MVGWHHRLNGHDFEQAPGVVDGLGSLEGCSSWDCKESYMTAGKTIVLPIWTFVGKVMSLLFHMLSRLVITVLPRSKRLLLSWLQSPSAVNLELKKISL